MPTYRKKPIEITAVQLRWTQWNEVCEFLGNALAAENPDGAREITADEASDTCGEDGPNYIAIDVRTIHGELATVRHGDWIIPDGEPGRFYPCGPDIFAKTYEPASEELAAPAHPTETTLRIETYDGDLWLPIGYPRPTLEEARLVRDNRRARTKTTPLRIVEWMAAARVVETDEVPAGAEAATA